MAAKGKYTERLHPRGHGGKFIKGLLKLQTVKDRNRATSTLARFRQHVLDRHTARDYHRAHGLMDPHREAVRRYFGGGYKDVNAAMREGRDHPDIAAIAEAMRPLQHDLVVSRRVEPAAFGLDSPDGLNGLVGKKVADAAFQAASLHDEPGQSGVTMHIAVPKGVPAVASEDGQLLLDRDTELAIVDAAQNGRGGWDVHAVLLKKPVPRGSDKPAVSAPAAGPAPTADVADLSKLTVPQLQAKVREAGLNPGRLRKADLVALLGGPAPAPKPVVAEKVAPAASVQTKLHQMIDAESPAEAEKIAATLKGKDLAEALASTPVGRYVTAKDTVATKRQHLVRWATSADAANGDAIRSLGKPRDPAEIARGRELDRQARRAEIKAPGPPEPRPVAPAPAPPVASESRDFVGYDGPIRVTPTDEASNELRDLYAKDVRGALTAAEWQRLDDLMESSGEYARANRGEFSRLRQEGMIQGSLDYWRSEHAPNMTDAELKADLIERSRAAFAGKKIAIRVTAANMSRILADGRFRTQFETDTSNGLLNPARRAAAEDQWFGLPPWSDPRIRPIYGYVAVEGVGAVRPKDALSQYGRVQVILKDSVRRRTTAQWGDSMNQQEYGLPEPVNEPGWMSYALASGNIGNRPLDQLDRKVDGPEWRLNQYVEAQIHGGVTVGDIEQVILPADAPKAIKDQLDAAGVKWVVM